MWEKNPSSYRAKQRDNKRELRLGWRLAERVSSGLAFELELGGTRRALAGAVARHGFTAGAGWRLFGRGAAAFGLHLEGALHEAENDARPEAAIGLRLGASW